ncbi:MAG: hypothetical protein JW840_00565 [Candidatus Thermoplasmatota archaeon]|nr:hypothetical protein [Candidatus Thermoplasmatota archaeon]
MRLSFQFYEIQLLQPSLFVGHLVVVAELNHGVIADLELNQIPLWGN